MFPCQNMAKQAQNAERDSKGDREKSRSKTAGECFWCTTLEPARIAITLLRVHTLSDIAGQGGHFSAEYQADRES